MILDILKRDLKHRKATNIIILLFVILAVLFTSSSVNNFVAVIGSLDRYFEKAEIGDYVAAEFYSGDETHATVTEEVQKLNGTTLRTEEGMKGAYEFVSAGSTVKGEIEAFVSCLSNLKYICFDSSNRRIEAVSDGDVFIRQSILDKAGAKVGDSVVLQINGVKRTFRVKDVLKDALLSIDIAYPRFLISDNEYKAFQEEIEESGAKKEDYLFYLHMIDTDDIESLETALFYCRIFMSGSRDTFRLFHITDMLLIGSFLAVSIGLILIAIAILGFTIGSTLSRESRQIGIMKAIGISNGKIRLIYLIKYLTIAVVGASVGLALSFPFGEMLLERVTDSISIENTGSVLYGVLSALAVTGLIMLLCVLFTRKVIRFTPANALRSGSTGERYRKKGAMRFGKKRVRPALFMAFNDILSSPRQTVIMLFVFFMGMTLLLIMLNTSSTLLSKDMVDWQGEKRFDLAIGKTIPDLSRFNGPGGREKIQESIVEVEKKLAEKGWDADCYVETRETATAYSKDNPEIIRHIYYRDAVNGSPEAYAYVEGRGPQNRKEVAVSYKTVEELHVTIGDSITVVTADGKEADYIITGIYQELMMKQWGSVRKYPESDYVFLNLSDVYPVNIRFLDHPSESEVNRRIEILREEFSGSGYEVRTVYDQLTAWMGDIPKKIGTVGDMLLPIIIIIDILVAVLMELSFLTKERREIAMLKAVGFRNRTIVCWQVLRIGIVMFAATLLAVMLASPIGRLTLGSVYQYLGIKKVVFVPNIWKNYILYPAAALASTVFSSFLVALGVRKFRSNEINAVE